MFYPVLNERVSRIAENVYNELGPMCQDNIYSECVAYELAASGVSFVRDAIFPINYKDASIDSGFRIGFIVEERMIIELKGSENSLEFHEAKLQACMQLTHTRSGMLIDFHVNKLNDGIRRYVI